MQKAPSWQELIAEDGRPPSGPMLLLPLADVGRWRPRACRPSVAVVESECRTRTSGGAGDVARTPVVRGVELSPSSPAPCGLVPSSAFVLQCHVAGRKEKKKHVTQLLRLPIAGHSTST
jgi:hypothetical protein